jgi:hypothetical protein
VSWGGRGRGKEKGKGGERGKRRGKDTRSTKTDTEAINLSGVASFYGSLKWKFEVPMQHIINWREVQRGSSSSLEAVRGRRMSQENMLLQSSMKHRSTLMHPETPLDPSMFFFSLH